MNKLFKIHKLLIIITLINKIMMTPLTLFLILNLPKENKEVQAIIIIPTIQLIIKIKILTKHTFHLINNLF
jgi:hypothetical protein